MMTLENHEMIAAKQYRGEATHLTTKWFKRALPLSTSTGIRNLYGSANLHIYPNPAMGSCVVSQESAAGAMERIILKDALGNVARDVSFYIPVSATTLNLSGLPAGLYFVEAHNKGSVATGRLIIC